MNVPREYPDRPVPGVGAVVLRHRDGCTEVLLVRRTKNPMAGSWSLPGGAIELGETAREACIREVFEETGLTVLPVADVEIFEMIIRDDDQRVKYHYMIVDMLCHVSGGELCAGSDAGETLWADAHQVLEHGDFALTPRACTVIRKAMDMDEGQ